VPASSFYLAKATIIATAAIPPATPIFAKKSWPWIAKCAAPARNKTTLNTNQVTMGGSLRWRARRVTGLRRPNSYQTYRVFAG
jgi:hypothetical protein